MMFRDPQFFWLLPIILLPLIAARLRRSRGRLTALGFSSVQDAKQAGRSFRAAGRSALPWLRTAAILLAIVALARPQAGDEKTKVRIEGIAIQLVVDNSGSMRELDMEIDGEHVSRLEAARRVIGRFVAGRRDDVIGLTTFSAFPNDVCPLTLDYGMLTQFFDYVRPDEIFGYTAIGDGMVQAAAALKESNAKSRVMILLTDGVNNFGASNPVEAARMASQLGIKIYAIGMVPAKSAPSVAGMLGMRLFPGGAEVDEEVLREVARAGGGRYYSAADGDALKQIYDEINQLEKSEQVSERFLQYSELFRAPLAAALALILLEILAALTLVRTLP